MTRAAGHDDDVPSPDGCADSVWLTKAQLAAVRKISLGIGRPPCPPVKGARPRPAVEVMSNRYA